MKIQIAIQLEAEDDFIEQKVLFEAEMILIEQVKQGIQYIATSLNQIKLIEQERELLKEEKLAKEI